MQCYRPIQKAVCLSWGKQWEKWTGYSSSKEACLPSTVGYLQDDSIVSQYCSLCFHQEKMLTSEGLLWFFNILMDVYPTIFFVCRSTVHSSTIPPNAQPNLISYENRQAEEASGNFRVTDAISGNASKVLRPPPRVPTGTTPPSCEALVFQCNNT